MTKSRTTTFVIKQTRYFYGPAEQRSLVEDPTTGWGAARFASQSEAEEHISYLEEGTYRQSHNEYGRPDYEIVPAGRLPLFLQAQL